MVDGIEWCVDYTLYLLHHTPKPQSQYMYLCVFRYPPLSRQAGASEEYVEPLY
jgi:hypothetical protein